MKLQDIDFGVWDISEDLGLSILGIECHLKVVFNQSKGAFEFIRVESPTIEIEIIDNIHKNTELLRGNNENLQK